MGAAPSPASRAAIEQLALAFGRPVDPAIVARLVAFHELLLLWNARINLTGARSADDLVADHLPDAFALARLVPDGVGLVDVGSGGGLPALPFALLRPDVRLTLVEPRAKRVAFLRAALRELAIPAEVVPGRLESIDRQFQVASSRATFPPPEWLEKAGPLVLPGGLVVLLLSGAGDTPPGARVVDSVSYRAGSKERLALAVSPPERST